MAILVNRNTPKDRWDDACLRLLAQYCDSSIENRKDFHFSMGRLNVVVDDVSFFINGKRHMFFNEGQHGEVLCKGVRSGAVPHLVYSHPFNGEPSLAIYDMKGGAGKKLAVIGQDSPAGMQLPREMEDYLFNLASSKIIELYPKYLDAFNDNIDKIYGMLGVVREDALASRIGEQLVFENREEKPVFVCNWLLMLDEEKLKTLKESVKDYMREHYDSMVQKGEMTGQEADSKHQENLGRLERYFSPDFLLEGWLSLQVSHIGMLRGEVQTDDIARVASWAMRDPEYKAYRERIDKWAEREAKTYNLKPEIVSKKQENLLGPKQQGKPEPLKSVKKSLSVRL